MNVRKVAAFFVILIFMLAVVYVAMVGVAWDIYEIRPLYEQVPQGGEFTGGVSIVFEAENASEAGLQEQLESVVCSMRLRLNDIGYPDAIVMKDGDSRIRVEIPIQDKNRLNYVAEFTGYLTKPALLEVLDPEGGVVFTGADLEGLRPFQTETNEFVMQAVLSSAAAKTYSEAVSKYTGQNFDVRLDGETISSPPVNGLVSQGVVSISGSFTEAAVVQTSSQIRSGALPIALMEAESRDAGPALGEGTFGKIGLVALVGFCLLLVFMGLYYRLSGLMAGISLLMNAVLLFLCCATIPGAKLSLFGMAGILLSMGMAADANILAIERIREEVRGGKTVAASIKAGFEKVFLSVMDGGLIVLIAAFGLFMLGADGIKELGVILLIGSVVGFLTSSLLTRGLMNLALGFPGANRLSFCMPRDKVHEKEQKGGKRP